MGGEAFHVFENHQLGLPCLCDSNEFEEQSPLVRVVIAMLASRSAETLTREAPCQNVEVGQVVSIDISDIAIHSIVARMVFEIGFSCRSINFNCRNTPGPLLCQTKMNSPNASEPVHEGHACKGLRFFLGFGDKRFSPCQHLGKFLLLDLRQVGRVSAFRLNVRHQSGGSIPQCLRLGRKCGAVSREWQG